MPGAALSGTNLELKARVPDLAPVRDRLRDLDARRVETECQLDRYVPVPAGRLKLRRSTADGAHLIFYARPEEDAVRESRFHRLPVADPDGLEETLSAMLGAGRTVEKTRELWWWRDVRVHLDRVVDLGSFVELESRVDRIGDREEALRRLERLASALGIHAEDALRESYGEMTR